MSENRIYIEVEKGKDQLPLTFVWNNKKYLVNKALMASYWPGSGYLVTITVKGKKHTLWLDGDDWFVEKNEADD